MSGSTARELLAQYEAALSALMDRGIIRTRNAVGDMGEAIAARAYGGVFETNNRADFDFTTPGDGHRYQVKTRTLRRGHSQAIIFKSWRFDTAILIGLSREDFGVVWGREVAVDEAVALAKDGMRFTATTGSKAGVDVTERLRTAYGSL